MFANLGKQVANLLTPLMTIVILINIDLSTTFYLAEPEIS
jgi:hypothetical protein